MTIVASLAYFVFGFLITYDNSDPLRGMAIVLTIRAKNRGYIGGWELITFPHLKLLVTTLFGRLTPHHGQIDVSIDIIIGPPTIPVVDLTY